jgi:hypothetical protein
MSDDGAAPGRSRCARACRHPSERCPRRGQPQERRQVARAEVCGRQGQIIAKCLEARHARPRLAERAQPNEPGLALVRPEYLASAPRAPGALHEPAAAWLPNEPKTRPDGCRPHRNQPRISIDRARVEAGS